MAEAAQPGSISSTTGLAEYLTFVLLFPEAELPVGLRELPELRDGDRHFPATPGDIFVMVKADDISYTFQTATPSTSSTEPRTPSSTSAPRPCSGRRHRPHQARHHRGPRRGQAAFAHNVKSKVEIDGEEIDMYRQNRAFGTATEHGTIFTSLRQMVIADEQGHYDKLLNFVEAHTGGASFVPRRPSWTTLRTETPPNHAPGFDSWQHAPLSQVVFPTHSRLRRARVRRCRGQQSGT